MPTELRALVLAAGLALAVAALAAIPARAQDWTDHHVHLLSPDLVRDWKSLGVPFSRPDSVYTSTSSLSVDQAVLVPMGHLYLNAEFQEAMGLSDAEAATRLRGENDWVAARAADDPDRFVALCSVNPLRDWVDHELDRCRSQLGVAGIKVHVASAEIDLRRTEHLEALARVATWVAEHDLLLLLHLDPQMRGHAVEHITRFADTVLGPNSELRVIIAHLGGSGGYGAWTRSVFGELNKWLDAHPERLVWFDISAVVLAEESEGVPATTQDQIVALRVDLMRFGLQRVVFGSDYPVFDPDRYRVLLKDRLGLQDAEFEQILGSPLPFGHANN